MVHKVRKDSVLAVYINICVNREVHTFKDFFFFVHRKLKRLLFRSKQTTTTKKTKQQPKLTNPKKAEESELA